MTYIIPVAPPASVPVADTDSRFPIRRVFCIGKNYSDHVREMGGDPTREEPLFFIKPADSVVGPGGAVPYPPHTENLHFEVELVVAIGRDVDVNAGLERVVDAVLGYGIGVDLTRRDMQSEAKKRGRPWDMSKSFDASALCSSLHLADSVGHPERGEIGLDLDSEPRQRGDISQMVWSIPEMLIALNSLFPLKAGDLLYTGTPSGVGPVTRGQTLEVWADGIAREAWTLS